MVFVEEGVEVLEPEEAGLLDYLSVDVGRPQRLDLGHEEVAYSFNSLLCVSVRRPMLRGMLQLTFRINFSSNGPRSPIARLSSWAAFFL